MEILTPNNNIMFRIECKGKREQTFLKSEINIIDSHHMELALINDFQQQLIQLAIYFLYKRSHSQDASLNQFMEALIQPFYIRLIIYFQDQKLGMFLSKKTVTHTVNKNKKAEDKPKRVLGGWDDDQHQIPKYVSNNTSTKQPQKSKIFSQQPILSFNEITRKVSQQNVSTAHQYYTWDELNQMTNISIQQKIIQQLIQPGGIRIKPTDNTLHQFLKEINGLPINIIASLLLSKIQVNYPFQIKAKALYTIEYLSKKNIQYLHYFQIQIDKLKQFPQPQDNVDNYKKILKNLLNCIGIVKNNQHNEQIKSNFIDPGYNQPQKTLKLSNFIKDNSITIKQKKFQLKKPIIGPNTLKNKVLEQNKQIKNIKINTNILQQDLLSIDKASNGNLLDMMSPQQSKINNKNSLNFEQMISSLSNGQSKEASLAKLNIF